MNRFIYVFSKDIYEYLLNKNYSLVKADEQNNIFVFENIELETLNFDFDNIEYVLTDVLTF